MPSKGIVLTLATAMAVAACGGVDRPTGDAFVPEGSESLPASSVDAGTTDVWIERTAEPAPSTPTMSDPVSAGEEPTEVHPSIGSTESSGDDPPSTTTSPNESIDLGEVQDALDTLEALFEGFDGHIGSVDLDEGDTP